MPSITIIPHLLWLHQVVLAAVLLGISAIPVWRCGSRPERASLQVLLSAVGTALLLRSLVPSRMAVDAFQGLDAAIGMIACVMLIRVAIKANRIYPLVMAAGQLIASLAHLLYAIGLISSHFIYMVPVLGGAYIALAALWIGTAVHVFRVRRHGPYPDWIA